MKLFHKIYMQVFLGMTVLAVGILLLLYSAMLRQSLSDTKNYGIKAFKNNISSLREYVQRETNGQVEKVVAEAVLIRAFSDIFRDQGVLWRAEKEVRNTSPYEFDQRLLKAMYSEAGQCEIWVSAPQNVGGKKILIFFQQNIPIGMDEYSLAVYQDVSDIMLRSRKILMQGIGFCAMILGIVGIIIYRQIRRLLLPLYELKCAATRIAQGDYDNCVIFSEKNEIGELTACFQQMTIQIREHIEAVTARNRQQKQLLGSLAHEMRTPITAVLANADMLLTLRLSPDEQNKALVFIIDEAKRMTHLSEKLLMLSGLCEPNESPLELRELTIQTILDRITVLSACQLQEKKLHLETCCVPIDLKKELDTDFMISLLRNLVDNACKASETGGRIFIAASAGQIVVQDFGKGIPSEELHRVTEAFYMVDKSRSRKEGGAGLGLALCQQIVQLHGWKLRIESTEGQGTRIVILW